MPFTPRCSPPRGYDKHMSVEERDARTVFCMQLSHRTTPKELEQFFEDVGQVRDVRIITDTKTRRSKGIGYVEFWELEAVNAALIKNGQKLNGAPLVVQPTRAERNRASEAAARFAAKAGAFSSDPLGGVPTHGPMKIYIGNLNPNITEEMLKGIFEPFGKLITVQVIVDDNGLSRGYAFITFAQADEAKKAIEQLNGFELAGQAMRVAPVQSQSGVKSLATVSNEEDLDDPEKKIEMNTTGRLQLMSKLAEGTGLSLPPGAQQVVTSSAAASAQPLPNTTQCFVLSNMFDPDSETDPNWEKEIRDDVIEECRRHGGATHVHVDKLSKEGYVYVKCPTIASAVASVNSLHGRFFSARVIQANYVPINKYHELFPESFMAQQILMAV